MKIHSRKKVLLSSVAMTLVAAVSLGTATFAWFTNNTSTTADGINVKTVQASNLQVASKAYAFTNDLDYNYNNQTFKPASSANGTAWFSGEAADANGFAIKDDSTYKSISDVVANNDYVFTDELNIRNYGGAAVDNVNITFTMNETATSEGMNYLRVAVVPKDAHNATSVGTLTGFTNSVFDKDGVAYNAVSGSAFTATTAITPKTEYTVSVGELAAKGTSWATDGTNKNEANYQIFVWFEGQDENCTNANAGNSLPAISMTISGKEKTAA